MFHKDIDCIENGAPHVKEAKEFKDFFDNYDNTKNSFFVRTYIMYDLFQKVEKLQEKVDFRIDEFNLLVLDAIKLAKQLTQNTNCYFDKLDNKSLKGDYKEFDLEILCW